MNRKLMVALAALLGFSTACSSVKNAPKAENDRPRQEAEGAVKPDSASQMRRVIVMYGVRRPIDDSVRMQQKQQGLSDPKKSTRVTVDPVAEKPSDD